jgi:hypothetical protein
MQTNVWTNEEMGFVVSMGAILVIAAAVYFVNGFGSPPAETLPHASLSADQIAAASRCVRLELLSQAERRLEPLTRLS